jgi:hypothetical protein
MTAPLIAKKTPDSDRVFALRRYLIGFLFIVVFVLLDRTTVYLQILPGISAWYPPVGIALALLIGMGPRYAPLYWLAGLISAKVNYHQPFFSYIFLPGNSLDFGTYTILAIVLRRVFKLDWRLTSIRDVMVLSFLALPLSGIAAFLATLTLVLDHVIPWSTYVKASLDWWVGDAVAIACLTPFCLVLVMPVVRRFTGLAQTAADMESASAGKSIHEAQGFRRAIESLCFVAAIVGSLWLALGATKHRQPEHVLRFLSAHCLDCGTPRFAGSRDGNLDVEYRHCSFAAILRRGPITFRFIAIGDAGSFADRVDTGHPDQRA